MVTISREIEIDPAPGIGVDDAVATGIVRAGANLGTARYARIRQTRLDASPRHRPDNKVHLLVTFVLDD